MATSNGKAPPLTQLEVGGVLYAGWKKIKIERSLEHVSGSFALDVTDRWSDERDEVVIRPIKPGESCRVLVGGEPVITGYIDRVSPRINAQERGLSIVGRDKTADLVDCAAMPFSQFTNTPLARLLAAIAAPFKINVIDQVRDERPIASFSVEPGETAFEAMKRVASMRGVLMISDGRGRLVITRGGTARVKTALVEGENILEAECDFSYEQRFSDYVVLAQSRGNDFISAANAAHVRGEAKDTAIKRYRPVVVFHDGDGFASPGMCGERAVWERNTRAGQGSRATVMVQGWRHADGLWVPNQLVRVRCPAFSINQDLLITHVTYSLDDHGTRAELSLAARQAFVVFETVKHKGKENPILTAHVGP